MLPKDLTVAALAQHEELNRTLRGEKRAAGSRNHKRQRNGLLPRLATQDDSMPPLKEAQSSKQPQHWPAKPAFKEHPQDRRRVEPKHAFTANYFTSMMSSKRNSSLEEESRTQKKDHLRGKLLQHEASQRERKSPKLGEIVKRDVAMKGVSTIAVAQGKADHSPSTD